MKKSKENHSSGISGHEDSTATSATKPPAAQIAENLLGLITWMDAGKKSGNCRCPGIHLHTHNNRGKDCRVHLDGVPNIHCLHESCREVVAEKSAELRRALDGLQLVPEFECSAEDKQRMKSLREQENLRAKVQYMRPRILNENRWTYQQIIKDSPMKLDPDPASHWRVLLSAFHPDDVVWIGETYDSGKPEHADRFKTATSWLQREMAPGPLICPATFKPWSISRGNASICKRAFLVVESDILSRDEVGAIFKWLRDRLKLALQAIVDTAGKSLHGWFHFPDEQLLQDLKVALPILGCDSKLFTPSQPVRLPGALRGDKHQKLVYFADHSQEVSNA